MVGFNDILDIGQVEDLQKIKEKLLVKLTKDINGRFDNYSSSPKTRQILLYWGYELVENDLFYNQNIIFSNNFCSCKNELLFV